MAIADISQFQNALGDAKSALVILPQNPSFDAVAAGLSMSLALKKQGISSLASSPSPMLVEFNRLVGVDKIREDIDDNNLAISFVNYPPDDIERVTCGIENGKFTLVVLPKTGNKAPMEDQIELSYAGATADLVIVVGANYPNDLGKFAQKKEVLEMGKLVLLSNNPLSGWPRAIELIDPQASCISEVANDVVEQSGLGSDEDIATNLFLGLEAGTRNFTSQAVTAETFARASKLLRAGAHRGPSQTQGHISAQKFIRGGQNFPPDWEDRGLREQTLP